MLLLSTTNIFKVFEQHISVSENDSDASLEHLYSRLDIRVYY
jgi:hypothetical protein